MPKRYAKTDQQDDVPEHFYKQKKSSKWSVRLEPSAALKALGAKAFKKSTRHAELAQAKLLGMSWIAEKLAEWEKLKNAAAAASPRPAKLDAALISRICAAREHSWTYSDNHEREQGITDAELQYNEAFGKEIGEAARSVIARGPASAHWAEMVEAVIDFAEVMGHTVALDDPQLPKLVLTFARAERDAQTRIAHLNRGDESDLPLPTIVPAGRKLSSVTDEYSKHICVANGKTKEVGTILNAWKHFIDFTGDMELDRVTSANVFQFFEDRVSAANKPWSLHRVRTFGVRTLTKIFAFARSTGKMTAENPMDKLDMLPTVPRAKEAASKKPRRPFTSKQLNTIFSSAWYNRHETRLFTGKMRTDLGARYWVPLIGLFHGNRVGEAVQLVASDFEVIDGVFSLKFREELSADDPNNGEPLEQDQEAITLPDSMKRTLKTAATKRIVPVHSKLIELGLPEFVAQCRKGGTNNLLFPSSLPNKTNSDAAPKLGRAYEQGFLRHVRDKLEFGHGYGNHSFRHQIEDRIRKVHARGQVWPPGVWRHYTGRAVPKGQGLDAKIELEGSERLYGDGYGPRELMKFVEQIDFSDVHLPPPYREWLEL